MHTSITAFAILQFYKQRLKKKCTLYMYIIKKKNVPEYRYTSCLYIFIYNITGKENCIGLITLVASMLQYFRLPQ